MITFEAPGGRTLSYSRRGSGPLVVCIPGGPGVDPEAYFAGFDLPGYELLILAPRGTGVSSPPPAPDGYRIAGYVEDVESLRVHLGADQLTIYGNSHGGIVALAYAIRFPARVARFAMTNAPARLDDAFMAAAADARERFAAAFADGAARIAAAEAADEKIESGELADDEIPGRFRTLMARYVAQEGPAETAYLDRLCAAPINWSALGPMYDELSGGLDLLADAGALTAPALIIGTEFDNVVPAAAMRAVADAVPTARYLEIAGAGHFPEIEACEELRTALTTFFGE